MYGLKTKDAGHFSTTCGFVNLAAFQIGWFACVLGGARHLPLWVGLSVVALVIGYHLYCAVRPTRELVLILLVGGIGYGLDSVLMGTTDMRYASGMPVDILAPYWLLVMWMQFATTLNVSLRWLKQRWLLAAAFGSIGGPLAYYSGSKMGAVSFGHPVLSLSVLALVWTLLTPALFALADRLDGMRPALRPAPS